MWPLNGLINLSSLDLADATGITSLEPLKPLTNLSSLDFSRVTGIPTPLPSPADLPPIGTE